VTRTGRERSQNVTPSSRPRDGDVPIKKFDKQIGNKPTAIGIITVIIYTRSARRFRSGTLLTEVDRINIATTDSTRRASFPGGGVFFEPTVFAI